MKIVQNDKILHENVKRVKIIHGIFSIDNEPEVHELKGSIQVESETLPAFAIKDLVELVKHMACWKAEDSSKCDGCPLLNKEAYTCLIQGLKTEAKKDGLI